MCGSAHARRRRVPTTHLARSQAPPASGARPSAGAAVQGEQQGEQRGEQQGEQQGEEQGWGELGGAPQPRAAAGAAAAAVGDDCW